MRVSVKQIGEEEGLLEGGGGEDYILGAWAGEILGERYDI